MVLAPCCEKNMGLKKGPWSHEEDHILISYIEKYGHANWRALPKQAGLLRCGKSCRLRWMNYLSPHIKRGNFTKEEEEDAIIHLHETLGNRWSAIAVRLPGRTDNEIKNIWHTHLKKRLNHYQPPQYSKRHTNKINSDFSTNIKQEFVNAPSSLQTSSSQMSTVTTDDQVAIKLEEMDSSSEYVTEIDESFWADERLAKENNSNFVMEGTGEEFPVHFPFSNVTEQSHLDMFNPITEADMDFLFNFFLRAEDLPVLPQL